MRKINKFTAVLCVVIIVAGVFASCAPKNPSDNSGEISDNISEDSNKPDDSSQDIGEDSEASTSQGRMSLQEVRDIIAENDSFKDILDALYRRQEPDEVYGSGVTLIDFWLDPYGDEKISIIKEQGEIYYECKNNGDTSSELIYDHCN